MKILVHAAALLPLFSMASASRLLGWCRACGRRSIEFASVALLLIMLTACSPGNAEKPVAEKPVAVADMVGPCAFFTDSELAELRFDSVGEIESKPPRRVCFFLSGTLSSTKYFIHRATIVFWARDVNSVIAAEGGKSYPFSRAESRGYYHRDSTDSYDRSCVMVFAVDAASSVAVELVVRRGSAGGPPPGTPVCPIAFELAPFIEGKVPPQPVPR